MEEDSPRPSLLGQTLFTDQGGRLTLTTPSQKSVQRKDTQGSIVRREERESGNK